MPSSAPTGKSGPDPGAPSRPPAPPPRPPPPAARGPRAPRPRPPAATPRARPDRDHPRVAPLLHVADLTGPVALGASLDPAALRPRPVPGLAPNPVGPVDRLPRAPQDVLEG